jgi:hypothetical protein
MLYTYPQILHIQILVRSRPCVTLTLNSFTYRFLSGVGHALHLPSNPSHTGLLSGVGHALYLLMLYTYFQILHIRDSCRGRPCFILTLQILHIQILVRTRQCFTLTFKSFAYGTLVGNRPCFILTLQILHIQILVRTRQCFILTLKSFTYGTLVWGRPCFILTNALHLFSNPSHTGLLSG